MSGEEGHGRAPSKLPYRTILDSSTDYAIFATDRAGAVTLWISGAACIFGWSEAKMAAHYTQKAQRRKLAKAAMGLIRVEEN